MNVPQRHSGKLYNSSVQERGGVATTQQENPGRNGK